MNILKHINEDFNNKNPNMKHIQNCILKALPASAMILAAGLCIGTAFAQEPGKSITIDPNKTTIATSPLLYGIFFEEINRAGEGGIYAEMIQNRSFEDKSRVDEVRDTPLAWGGRSPRHAIGVGRDERRGCT